MVNFGACKAPREPFPKGAAFCYALESVSIFSMSARAKRIPRPKCNALIRPIRLHRRSVMGVIFQRAASSAGVRNGGVCRSVVLFIRLLNNHLVAPCHQRFG